MRTSTSRSSNRRAARWALGALLAAAALWPAAVGATGRESPHGELAIACTQCHTTAKWAPLAKTIPFRHDTTGFALAGAHAQLDCRKCHQSLVFSHVGTACRDCHRDPHAGELGARCETCHGAQGWSNQRQMFDVHSRTLFPLLAAHARVECAGCHGGQRPQQYASTPTDCVSCHRRDFETATNPSHAGFSTNCQGCHLMPADSWHRTSGFVHPASFPLSGAHARVACTDCHRNGYTNARAECESCHRQDYQQAREPNHVAANFPTTCQTCHTTTAWQPATFDHARSGFPLEGAHAAVACASCHKTGYSGTPKDCYACHRTDYEGTRDPNHVQAGIPTGCVGCHSQSAWRPATNFDHSRTGFPLDGAHRNADCASCHKNGYAGTPKDCYSCHRPDYEGTRDPNHVQQGYPTSCQGCHTTAAWRPAANFDHAATGFPLDGAHRGATCESCHKNGVYAGTPKDCYACHRADYQGTRNPNHQQGGYPTTCQSCHSETAWQPANFNHDTTSFPLTGAHRSAACASCHQNGVYGGTPKDCYACHRSDYQGTRDPNHQTGGFPTTCQTCHSTSAWQPASFNHDATSFPLTGAHRSTACASCHKNGVYAGTPKDCYSCHRTDYEATRDPNHVQQGFPTGCQTCHTTNAWQPANFNHNATRFPLTGAHVSTPCASCHKNGVYAGTPRDCYSCHVSDYQTAQPNHAASGFPTTCEGCHTTNSWAGATFDHDARFFPIYSGKHRSVWPSCSTCHVAPGNFAVFECILCHEHSRDRVDSHHGGVRGYSYDSQACYRCHPNGQAGD